MKIDRYIDSIRLSTYDSEVRLSLREWKRLVLLFKKFGDAELSYLRRQITGIPLSSKPSSILIMKKRARIVIKSQIVSIDFFIQDWRKISEVFKTFDRFELSDLGFGIRYVINSSQLMNYRRELWDEINILKGN